MAKKTFGLFETQVRALEFLDEKENYQATSEEIHEASSSRAADKHYVAHSLAKKGFVEILPVGENFFRREEDKIALWRMTVDGYKKLEEYRRNQARIGELNID